MQPLYSYLSVTLFQDISASGAFARHAAIIFTTLEHMSFGLISFIFIYLFSFGECPGTHPFIRSHLFTLALLYRLVFLTETRASFPRMISENERNDRYLTSYRQHYGGRFFGVVSDHQ